jgi:GxxExxY protein
MDHDPIPGEDEALAHEIIGAAIEVHRLLGPGFLESIYERALGHELSLRGIGVERQKEIIVRYKELDIPGQRLDLLVGGRVITDLKTVETIAPSTKPKCFPT